MYPPAQRYSPLLTPLPPFCLIVPYSDIASIVVSLICVTSGHLHIANGSEHITRAIYVHV